MGGKSKKKSKGKSTAENEDAKGHSSGDAVRGNAPETGRPGGDAFPDVELEEVDNKRNEGPKTDRADSRKRENRDSSKDRHSSESRNVGGYKSRQSEPSRTGREYGNSDRRTERNRYSLNENERGKRAPRDSSYNRRKYKPNFYQDPEYQQYEEEFTSHKGNVNYSKINEIVSDLFEAPSDYSLAHCVAEDMNMGSGIAVQFRRDFKRVDELLNQQQSTGGLAILTDKNRYIYYLVTKKFSTGKPTYASLFSSLKRLRGHVIENKVENIAMPRIGCGLDRLEWPNVKFMLQFVFRDVDVQITVCNLEPMEDSSPQQKHRNCRVKHEKYPIEKIEKGTVILYFSSEDEHITEDMRQLDEQFHFLNEFRHARKVKGDAILYTRNPNYLLCGCIVRKTPRDHFDFKALQKCLSLIQKENRKYNFYYYAFQAVKDESDLCLNYKILNILRNALREVEVYVCWPGDLQNYMAPRDRFLDDNTDDKWRPKNNSFATNWRGEGKERSFNDSENSVKEQSDDYWTAKTKENASATNENHWDVSFVSTASTGDVAQSNSAWYQESASERNDSHWDDSAVSTVSTGQVMQSNNAWSQGEEDKSSEKQLQSSSKPSTESHQERNLRNVTQPQNTQKSEESHINHEYESFQLDLESGSISHTLKEQESRDLPKQYSRVCYAREDLIIEGGIAPGDDISPQIGKLLNRKEQSGGLVTIKEGNNFLYFLIISPPNKPPTSQSVFSAIQKLRDNAKVNRVKKLVIPILKSKNDGGLKWSKIKSMFDYLLGKMQIDMIAAPFDSVYDVDSLSKQNKSSVSHGKSAIHQMKKKSVILYIASADGQVTEEMEGLSKKFVDFRQDFLRKPKKPGDVIKYKENEDHVLYGCIARQSNGEIDFEQLRKCVCAVNEKNKNGEKLPNVGIQAGKDQSTNFKILSVLLHSLQEVKITMCWPGDLRSLMPSK